MENVLVFQGRLAKDVELKYTASQIAYTEFTVCWSEKYKEIETKCFLRCKAWRGMAEFLGKYFSKGSMVLIRGHMVTEEWEKDGQKNSRTICMVDKANFCGSRSEGGSAPQTSQSMPAPGDDDFMQIPDGIEDELPFN